MKSNRQEMRTISEQAAEWLVLLAEGDAAQQAGFMVWLKQSPRHVEEFLFATTMWNKLNQPGATRTMDADEIVAEAIGAGSASNVVALEAASFLSRFTSSSLSTRVKKDSMHRRRVRWLAGLAAAMVAISIGAWWYVAGLGSWLRLATEVGEQRTVRLMDGSVLYLNTASRARVDFSQETRRVELLDGEALFVVAHDAGRPFRVMVGDAVIQAVGTQFNVRRRIDGTRVSVIEGRVKVGKESLRSDAGKNILAAGDEALIAGDGRIVRHEAADVGLAVAWRERRLVFRAERLEDVVAEINRYSTRRFHVEGEKARDTRLTATFDADKPEALAAFLRQYSDLAVEQREEEFVIRAVR
jgi:transmembrane sensor